MTLPAPSAPVADDDVEEATENGKQTEGVENEADENKLNVADDDDDDSLVDEPLDDPGFGRPKFPSSFYDPKTNLIMRNPVVDANGDSCEMPASMIDGGGGEDGNESKDYYPNRALRSIIQRETQRSLNSIVGSLRRLDDSARKTWSQMVDKSVLATTDYRPLPDSFYCPITQDLMVDPVIAPDGNSFEREAIVNWIRANGTNPVTRQPLTIAGLRRNNNLYDLIQEEKNRPNLSERHPSIRRWIASEVPTSRRTLGPEDLVEPTHSTTTSGNVGTPINYAQIAEARRRRSQNDRSWTVLFVFTIIVILMFVPSHSAFLVLGIALFSLSCCKSVQERRLLDEQRQAARQSTGS